MRTFVMAAGPLIMAASLVCWAIPVTPSGAVIVLSSLTMDQALYCAMVYVLFRSIPMSAYIMISIVGYQTATMLKLGNCASQTNTIMAAERKVGISITVD